MSVIIFWKQLFCSHDYRLIDSFIAGATMGWSGNVTRTYEFNYRCDKCDHCKNESGILHGDKQRHPECYDSSGCCFLIGTTLGNG